MYIVLNIIFVFVSYLYLYAEKKVQLHQTKFVNCQKTYEKIYLYQTNNLF